jgi:hypothetical protein
MMKRASSLLVLAVVATASFAHGENKPGQPPPVVNPGVNPGIGPVGDYDFSGKAALSNPALMKEIDDTLIRGASCRSMAPLGYGNGYQCPAAGLPACMKMLTAGKVDACAVSNNRDYALGCGAKETTPEGRATGTCSDLSADLWKSLAIRIPYANVKKRLEAFGCKAEAGTTMFCPSHLREWLCQPFERGGVVVCRPPKIVKQCTGGEFPTCSAVET